VKARDFDKKFDEGGDITKHFDKKRRGDRAGTEKGQCGFSRGDDSTTG
jgi:hypothetical protein